MSSEYLCPITKDIMIDPVSDENGHTFERSAIEGWLRTSDLSPMTNQKYKTKQLHQNWALKNLIENLTDLEKYDIRTNSRPVKKQKIDDWDIVNNVIDIKTSSVQNDKGVYNTAFSIKSSRVKNGVPVDLVLLVDRSGSMNSDVSAKDANGNNLENGLTSMCIVKHALKTIVNMLDENDRVSVVLYDNVNEILCNLYPTNDQATSELVFEIEKIEPRGGTNIYGAIECAIDIISKRTDKSRKSSIILLTDGQANQSPSQGEVVATREALLKNIIPIPIHTFAFGSNTNSKLLYDISRIASGMFCFIPDGGMVGTTFVNAISNIKCIAVNRSTLFVEALNGARLLTETTPGFHVIDTGFILHDQERHFIVDFDLSNHDTGTDYCKYRFEYGSDVISDCNNVQGSCVTSRNYDVISNNDFTIIDKQYRLFVIEKLHKLLQSSHNLDTCNQIIDELVQMGGNTEPRKLLLENINDQVRIAFSEKEYVRTWSLHYIRSLVRSLELEIKSNFKDPALSSYTNDMFNEICKYGDEIFNNLEPPKPKKIKRDLFTGAVLTQASQSMQTYNLSSNPCFDGNCLIRMADNTLKPVKELVKGSYVWTPDGPSLVRCILETKCTDSKADLV